MSFFINNYKKSSKYNIGLIFDILYDLKKKDLIIPLMKSIGVNQSINHFGATSLMYLVCKGSLPDVIALLKENPDINAKINFCSKPGLRFINIDQYQERPGTLLTLGEEFKYSYHLEHIRYIKESRGATALYLAAGNNKYDITKKLLEAGADTEVKTSLGDTALANAATNDHISIVELLIAHNADKQAKSMCGTPISRAINNRTIQNLLDS